MADRIIDVEVDGLATQTEKAWCVRHGRKMIWVPKSLAEYDPCDNVITLPEWLAQEKELI
jgi:hypothetical protein